MAAGEGAGEARRQDIDEELMTIHARTYGNVRSRADKDAREYNVIVRLVPVTSHTFRQNHFPSPFGAGESTTLRCPVTP